MPFLRWSYVDGSSSRSLSRPSFFVTSSAALRRVKHRINIGAGYRKHLSPVQVITKPGKTPPCGFSMLTPLTGRFEPAVTGSKSTREKDMKIALIGGTTEAGSW